MWRPRGDDMHVVHIVKARLRLELWRDNYTVVFVTPNQSPLSCARRRGERSEARRSSVSCSRSLGCVASRNEFNLPTTDRRICAGLDVRHRSQSERASTPVLAGVATTFDSSAALPTRMPRPHRSPRARTAPVWEMEFAENTLDIVLRAGGPTFKLRRAQNRAQRGFRASLAARGWATPSGARTSGCANTQGDDDGVQQRGRESHLQPPRRSDYMGTGASPPSAFREATPRLDADAQEAT